MTTNPPRKADRPTRHRVHLDPHFFSDWLGHYVPWSLRKRPRSRLRIELSPLDVLEDLQYGQD